VRSQSVRPASRFASKPMSKRNWLVRTSTLSSSGVSRSASKVANPAALSARATWRLRGLKRLLPLPCANSTSPRGASGKLRSASSVASPTGIRSARCLADGGTAFMVTSRWDRFRAPRRPSIQPRAPAARPPVTGRSGSPHRTAPAARRKSSGSAARSPGGR
jgi:hypothetical protein